MINVNVIPGPRKEQNPFPRSKSSMIDRDVYLKLSAETWKPALVPDQLTRQSEKEHGDGVLAESPNGPEGCQQFLSTIFASIIMRLCAGTKKQQKRLQHSRIEKARKGKSYLKIS